ncbi:MAG: GNAT family N-acetyltransferase [Chloroflexota bacterium]
MSNRDDFKPANKKTAAYEMKRVEIPLPELNWFLHQAVGADFLWGGRENWGREEWTTHVDRVELETWMMYVSGTPAGYFEIEYDDGSRIRSFGLLKQFFGQGLGGVLLNKAVDRSWDIGAARVWLTTCTHDHPNALKNYLARGFKVIEEKIEPANSTTQSILFKSSAK